MAIQGIDLSNLVSSYMETYAYSGAGVKEVSGTSYQPERFTEIYGQLADARQDVTRKPAETQAPIIASAKELTPQIITLEGNNLYEMGEQYGRQHKDDLLKFYDEAINKTFIAKLVPMLIPMLTQKFKAMGLSDEAAAKKAAEAAPQAAYGLLLKAAYKFYETYPPELQKFYDGMEKTSGMKKDDLVLLSQILRLGFVLDTVQRQSRAGSPEKTIKETPAKVPVQCTTIAAWGEYTKKDEDSKGSNTIVASNFDYYPMYKELNENLAVTKLKFKNSGAEIAFVGLPGQLDVYRYIYKKDGKTMFVGLNAGPLGVKEFTDEKNGTDPATLVLDDLINCNGFEDLCKRIEENKAGYPFIITVIGEKQTAVYEQCAMGTKKRPTGNNTSKVVGNRYLCAWPVQPPSDTATQSVKREENSRAFLEKEKGTIDIETAENYLNKPLEKGGVTQLNNPDDLTHYQLVINIEKGEAGLQIPGATEWVKIYSQTDIKGTESEKANETKQDEEVINGQNLLKPIQVTGLKCLYGKDGKLQSEASWLLKRIGFKKVDDNTILFYGKILPLFARPKEYPIYSIKKNEVTEIKFESTEDPAFHNVLTVTVKFFGEKGVLLDEKLIYENGTNNFMF